MARKDAEKFFLNFVKKMAPKSNNHDLYRETFELMSDKEFKSLVERIRTKEVILPIFYQNMSDNVADVENIMAIGESLGVNWFQHLELTDQFTLQVNKTPIKYLVLNLPVRRQIQHLRDKISLPKTDKKIDHLTGQATGKSKGASITAPELQVLDDKGLTNTVNELAKVRGGDNEAYLNALEQIDTLGSFSLAPIEALGSVPQASITLKKLLEAGHLSTTGLAE